MNGERRQQIYPYKNELVVERNDLLHEIVLERDTLPGNAYVLFEQEEIDDMMNEWHAHKDLTGIVIKVNIKSVIDDMIGEETHDVLRAWATWLDKQADRLRRDADDAGPK